MCGTERLKGVICNKKCRDQDIGRRRLVFMIPFIPNRVSTTSHQNVNGKELFLHTIHHDHNRLCVEYVVENAKLYSLYDVFVIFPLLTIFLLETVFEYRSLGYGVLFLISLYYSLSKLLWKVQKECILIVASTGIQVKVVYASGQNSTQFIPWSSIKDVIIQECIIKQRVLYYLSVMIEEKVADEVQTTLVPLLTETTPRLSGIERIYCDVHRIIDQRS